MFTLTHSALFLVLSHKARCLFLYWELVVLAGTVPVQPLFSVLLVSTVFSPVTTVRACFVPTEGFPSSERGKVRPA